MQPPLPAPRRRLPATQHGLPPVPPRKIAPAPPESECPIEYNKRPPSPPPSEIEYNRYPPPPPPCEIEYNRYPPPPPPSEIEYNKRPPPPPSSESVYNKRPLPPLPSESVTQYSALPQLQPRQRHLAEGNAQRHPPPPPPHLRDHSTLPTVRYYNSRPSQAPREYDAERPSQSRYKRAPVYPVPLHPTDCPTQRVSRRPLPQPPKVFTDNPMTPSSPGYTSKRPAQSSQEHDAVRPRHTPTQTTPSSLPASSGEYAPQPAQVFSPHSFTPPTLKKVVSESPIYETIRSLQEETLDSGIRSLRDETLDSGMRSLLDDTLDSTQYLEYYLTPVKKYQPPLSPSARPIHRHLVTTPRSPDSPPKHDRPEADGATAKANQRWSTGMHLISRASRDLDVEPEEYFQTDTVLGLNKFNFDTFIKTHEKTLVMFFHSLNTGSYYPSREFANASMKSSNQNHVYAAVDCYGEDKLCCRENANQLPMIKLYSNGFVVSSLSFVKGFTADQMNMLMTMAPVLTQPRKEPSKYR